jgi:hypothetical protein
MLLTPAEYAALMLLLRGQSLRVIEQETTIPKSRVLRLRDEVGIPSRKSWQSIRARRDAAIEAYVAGVPKDEILATYRVDQRILYKELKKRGIRLRATAACILSAEMVENIRRMRARGWTWMYIVCRLRLPWTPRVVSQTYRHILRQRHA